MMTKKSVTKERMGINIFGGSRLMCKILTERKRLRKITERKRRKRSLKYSSKGKESNRLRSELENGSQRNYDLIFEIAE